jgi:hypothetical protein
MGHICGIKENEIWRMIAIAVVVMAAVAFAIATQSDGSDGVQSGKCGNDLTWELDDDGNLTISGQGEMFDYYYIEKPWGTDVKSLTVESGVESVGGAAFTECTSLLSVTLPDSVSSIEEAAFFGCTSLLSVTLPDSVSSIGVGAFFGCTSLTTIAFPSSLTYIGLEAFSRCTSLLSVTLPDSVRYIDSCAFTGCKSLTFVTILGLVKTIAEETFSGCTNLKYVILPDSLESIESYAFYDCKNLRYISLPESLRYIDNYAFALDYYSMYDPTSLVFHIDDSGLPGYAYVGTGNGHLYLQHYALEYSVSEVGQEATVTGFRGTADDVTILPFYNGYRITAIADRAFYGCEDLKSISIDSSVKSIGNYAFYNCASLESVGLGSVESVGLKSFSYCQSLRSIAMPATLKNIGGYAFFGCGLESIKIPGNAAVGKGAFSECKDLKTVSFTGHGTVIGTRAFYNDSSLSSVDFSGAASIGLKAFPYCDGLISVVIPGCVSAVGGYAFFNCANLREITIEDGVEKIGKSAFSVCKSLEMVELPETLAYMGSNAFYGVKFLDLDGKKMEQTLDLRGHTYYGSGKVLRMTDHLEKGEVFSAGGIVYSVSSVDSRTVTVTGYEGGAIAVPSHLTYKGWDLKVTAVAAKALYGCSTLKSADLANVRSIGMKALAYCTSLEEASFGTDLSSVGAYAFFGLSFYYSNIELQPDPVMLAGRSFAGSDGALFMAEDASPYVVLSGSCGEDVRFCLDSRGNLMITGTGPMYDYSWASYTKTVTAWWGNYDSSTTELTYYKSTAPWFENLAPGDSYSYYAYGFSDIMAYNATPIENIVVGEGVTTVGNYAFYDSCYGGWENVDCEEYASTIGSVSLPDTVVSIGDYAFTDCYLSSVNIPSSVNIIGDRAFYPMGFFDEDGNRLPHDAESLAGYSYEGHNGKLYRVSS